MMIANPTWMRTAVAVAATGALLAACSSDAGVGAGGAVTAGPRVTASAETSSAAATDGAPAESPAPEPTAAAADEADTEVDTDTVYGTAVVDGVEYELHELRRCEPSDADQVDRDLELTARGYLPTGEGHDGGDWVQIDVYVQQIAGTDFDQVSWAGPEGVFGTNGPTEVNYGGDRVSGTAVMVDALTQEPGVSVTYDVEVPDELIDCRL